MPDPSSSRSLLLLPCLPQSELVASTPAPQKRNARPLPVIASEPPVVSPKPEPHRLPVVLRFVLFFGKISLPIPAVSFRGIGKVGTKSPSGRPSLGLAPGNSVTLAGQEERRKKELCRKITSQRRRCLSWWSSSADCSEHSGERFTLKWHRNVKGP